MKKTKKTKQKSPTPSLSICEVTDSERHAYINVKGLVSENPSAVNVLKAFVNDLAEIPQIISSIKVDMFLPKSFIKINLNLFLFLEVVTLFS